MNTLRIFSSAALLFSMACVPFAHAEKSTTIRFENVHVIKQKDIPLVINSPGEYVLKQNITYKGAGNAITVAANNVKLNLRNFSIILTNHAATGILVSGVSEVDIISDEIVNTSNSNQTGFGVHVIDANKVFLENLFTVNHFNGLFVENSSDITILNSQFLDPVNAGGEVSASTNVKFNACIFDGSAINGLLFNGANQDCTVTNSDFPNSQFTNLLVQQIKGMMVDNCSFTNNGGDPEKANIVQFGDAVTPEQIAFDITFTNCTIVNRPPAGGNTAPEGLGLYNVFGALVDSCVIDIDNTGQDPDEDLSSIHFGTGSEEQIGTNITIRNTISQGPATNGFYPDEGCSNIVIDSCLASNALKDGIFVAGTSASVVQNCTVVNNGTNGIFIGEESFDNAILNNVVTQNGFNPIITSLPPTGTGIGIHADSFSNLIQDNKVFENSTNIVDNGTNNHFIDNTVF